MLLHDASRTCPKCGGNATSKFVPRDLQRRTEEYMARRCEDCSYHWKERPRDHATVPEQHERLQRWAMRGGTPW